MCKQQEDSEDEHNRVHEIELYNQEETARNYRNHPSKRPPSSKRPPICFDAKSLSAPLSKNKEIYSKRPPLE